MLMFNCTHNLKKKKRKPGANSEQAQQIAASVHGYKYEKLSLNGRYSFVCIYRNLVWPRLALSIPSAVCFAMLEACQSGSVSSCTALLSQADHELAKPAALA